MKFIYTLILFICFNYCFGQGITLTTWTTENLDAPRQLMGAAATDSLFFFAGGNEPGFTPSDRVEIYDVDNQTWSDDTLSIPRTALAGIANGNKVFFAGGFEISTGVTFNTVDIYNISTSEWTTDTLSFARAYLSAVAVGDKVMFAGGAQVEPFFNGFQTTDIIDIYDLTSQSWSTANLSLPRALMGATVTGDKVFFAGGAINNDLASNRIDIYDASDNTWTIDSLSSARIQVSAASINGKVYFAGGHDVMSNSYTTIDIYDTLNNDWSMYELFQARKGIAAAVACDRIYFMGGSDINWDTKFTSNSYDHVDIYDSVLDEWMLDFLPEKRASASAASSENVVMIAGGFDQPGGQLLNSADVQMCSPTVGNKNLSIDHSAWKIYPNPVVEKIFTIDFKDMNGLIKSLKIYSSLGRTVLTKNNLTHFDNPISINTNSFSEGIYFVQIINEAGRVGVKKLIVQK